VASALAGAGCAVRELHREQSTLEDVFTSLTTRDLAAHPEPAQASPISSAGAEA
jgi:hypothetical protein